MSKTSGERLDERRISGVVGHASDNKRYVTEVKWCITFR